MEHIKSPQDPHNLHDLASQDMCACWLLCTVVAFTLQVSTRVTGRVTHAWDDWSHVPKNVFLFSSISHLPSHCQWYVTITEVTDLIIFTEHVSQITTQFGDDRERNESKRTPREVQKECFVAVGVSVWVYIYMYVWLCACGCELIWALSANA